MTEKVVLMENDTISTDFKATLERDTNLLKLILRACGLPIVSKE